MDECSACLALQFLDTCQLKTLVLSNKYIMEYFISRSSVKVGEGSWISVLFLMCSCLRRGWIPLIHLVLRTSATGCLHWTVFLLKMLAISIHVAWFCATWRAEDVLTTLFYKALFQEREIFCIPCSLNVVWLIEGQHTRRPKELLWYSIYKTRDLL